MCKHRHNERVRSYLLYTDNKRFNPMKPANLTAQVAKRISLVILIMNKYCPYHLMPSITIAFCPTHPGRGNNAISKREDLL